MGLKDLTASVTRKVGRQVLTVKAHSPILLMGAGVVGFGATVFLASKATLKMSGILDEAEELDNKVAEASEKAQAAGLSYTAEDMRKDRLTVRVKTAIKIAKLYAPAVVIGGASVACFVTSHSILNKRNAGLSVALMGATKAFNEYRGRVVAELGKQKDLEFRYGVVERTIGVQTDEGVVEKTVRGIDQEAMLSDGDSMYAKVFSRSTSARWQPVPVQNELFLKSQQNWMNDLLNSRGHVFLNEVYESLGFEHTEEGAVVGWIRGYGDQEIDLNVFDVEGLREDAFVNGDVDSVLLDFNVHGPIYKLLGKNKKD
jgi:uncharacterized protein YdcH (DUF465 family)